MDVETKAWLTKHKAELLSQRNRRRDGLNRDDDCLWVDNDEKALDLLNFWLDEIDKLFEEDAASRKDPTADGE